jgi:hypothetical protein
MSMSFASAIVMRLTVSEMDRKQIEKKHHFTVRPKPFARFSNRTGIAVPVAQA